MTYNYSDISLSEYPGETSLVLYSGSCSLQCPWCFNPDLLNKEPLSYKQAKDAIDEHRDFITAVVLTGGEPLVNPFLLKILDYARDNGLKIKLNTNGFKGDTKYVSSRGWSTKIDYLHVSLKPNYSLPPISIDLPFALYGAFVEYSFVYSKTFLPDKYLKIFAADIIKIYKTKDPFWRLSFVPDIFTIQQFQEGNCLNKSYNDCSVPSREECVNALTYFKELNSKFIVETKEFGREYIDL